MPSYRYHAIRPGQSSPEQGLVEAEDAGAAARRLKSEGLHPTRVVAERSGVQRRRRRVPALRRERTVRAETLARVTRQLATLLGAGLPLLRALELLVRQEREEGLRTALDELRAAVQGGVRLSEAMARRPEVFGPVYLAMVRAGEAGGVLDVVLARLAGTLERAARVRARVKAALTYPMILTLVASVIVWALTAFVVPRFEEMFLTQLSGRPLPELTRGVLAVSRLLGSHPGAVLGGGVALAAAVAVLRQRPKVRDRAARLSLHLPVYGEWSRQSATARLGRTLGTLLGAGVPILQAMELAAAACGHPVFGDAARRVHQEVERGEPLAAALARQAAVPPVVAALVEVGEATGKVPEMLERAAEIADEQVEQGLLAFTALIEPALLVTMAVVVGTIVVALFLPLIEIIRALSGG
jgi:type IV pilus assembly protein PilC